MKTLRIEAPAKINWRLAVTGRRADGYHMLTGLMQSISLSDTVYLRESSFDSCYTSPPLPRQGEDNLALKAWLLLKRKFGLSQCLDIAIEKRIPVGGGLGGGSADAAAVLKGANMLFDLRLSDEELSALGLSLGADVPFCLLGGLAKAEGLGETLTPQDTPAPLHILLANPGFIVPTARVFKHYRTSKRPFSEAHREELACAELAAALANGDIKTINTLLDNDLAFSARRLYPKIGLLEWRIRGMGLHTLVSGSGGTVFAVMKSAAALQKAQQALVDLPWVGGATTLPKVLPGQNII